VAAVSTRTLLAIGCAAAIWWPASAAPRAGSQTAWTYGSSDHFEVYTSGDAKRAREALTDFERLRGVFAYLLHGSPPAAAAKTRLIVFSSLREFVPYRANENSNALWLGTPDGDFILLSSLDDADLGAAIHEYAHLAMGWTGAGYPLWLNEGLAQYYSTMRPWGSKLRVGLELPHALDTLSKATQLIPLERLFAIDDRSPEDHDPRTAAVFYAESWAFTHMLLLHDQYRDRAQAFFASLAGGAPAPAALQQTYRKALDAVNADFRNYLSRFKLASVLVDGPPSAASPSESVRTADDVDVQITLASIVGWEPGREAEARAALTTLETRAPKSVRLAEARGLLETFTGRCDAAGQYLARAVALGSADPAVLRADAALVARDDPAAAARLLSRASEIAPDASRARPQFGWSPCGGR
jgi:hypothetical protein